MNPSVSVILGPTYHPTLWDLRKRVAAARRAKEAVVIIQLGAPINAETVEVAILSGSLYLIGLRGAAGVWREFQPDVKNGDPSSAPAKPNLPNSRWIMRGGLIALSSYQGLGLPWMLRKEGSTGFVTYSNTPLELVRFLRRWEGNLASFEAQLSLSVLVMIVCEALRFKSIEKICSQYIWPIGGVSADPTARPVLTLDLAMLETVQNWDTVARAGSADIWTWPPDMPDLIVS